MKRTALLALVIAGLLTAVGAGTAGGTATKAPSPLYWDMLTAYMEGRWETLEGMFKDKAREIGALEKGEAADVAVMRAALAEGRPAWWAMVKTKKKVDFKVNVWGRPMLVTFDPESQSNCAKNSVNGVPTMTVNWLISDMDNPAPAEHGFSKGDLGCFQVFNVLGTADTWMILPPLSMQLDDAGKAELLCYLEFRGHVTAAEYGNPRARQWAMFLDLLSYKKEYEKLNTRMARKAVAAMFLGELLSHRETYASVQLPSSLEAEDAEEKLAIEVAGWVEKHPLTFAEDNALRAAIKVFAMANLAKPHTTGKVELPNKLLVALDQDADDKECKAKRDAWVKQAFDKLPKRPN